MPVYNGEKYLREAIESILNQSFNDFEFIIINDGSNDKTEEIVLSYSDPRIVYIKNESNLHIVRTLNKGIKLAQGKYIARMDADDISLPKRLEKQVKFMDENPDIDVCGCYLKTIGAKSYCVKYPLTPEAIRVALLFYSPLPHPAVIIRKSFFQFQTYNINYQNAEDYHLWASNFENSRFANIPDILFCYRLHDSQITNNNRELQIKLSNDIKYNILQEIGINITKKEKEIHGNILYSQCVDLEETEDWLYKLCQYNEIKSNFKKIELDKCIDNIWWLIVNSSTKNGLKTFFIYYKSKKIRIYSKTILQNIKFFIKCLIKYK